MPAYAGKADDYMSSATERAFIGSCDQNMVDIEIYRGDQKKYVQMDVLVIKDRGYVKGVKLYMVDISPTESDFVVVRADGHEETLSEEAVIQKLAKLAPNTLALLRNQILERSGVSNPYLETDCEVNLDDETMGWEPVVDSQKE